MKRKLDLGGAIIEGSVKRELEDVFPELINTFQQRKSYDEYHYLNEIEVEVDLFKLENITKNLGYEVTIYYDTIIIK